MARFIRIWLKQLFYMLLNRFSKKSGTNEQSQLVVSLTTYPARINLVYLTIESIFNQKYKAKEVYLWIAKEEAEQTGIPKSLKRLERRGLKICYNEQNLKSFDKLVHTWNLKPQQAVVTADDDVLYPRYWLANFAEQHQLYPTTVLCFRGHHLRLKDEHNLHSYMHCYKNFEGGDKPSLNIMPTGVSGVLYPIGSLHEDYANIENLKGMAPSSDDVWFKAMTLLNNTDCKRILPRNKLFDTVRMSQKETLMRTNNSHKAPVSPNDQALTAVFNHYNLHQKLFKSQ